jgi:hypothetical protein
MNGKQHPWTQRPSSPTTLPQWASEEHGQRQDPKEGTSPSPVAVVPAKFTNSGRPNWKSIKISGIDGKAICLFDSWMIFITISKIILL